MERTPDQRVVVTGIGIVSPVGTTREETWAAIVAGRSGIAPLARIDPDGLATRFAGEVKEFDPAARLGRKEARRMDRYTQFAAVAALEALEQSGFVVADDNAERVGALIGTAMGGMETLEQASATLLGDGPSRIGPFFVPMFLPNMASGTVAIVVGARG